MYFCHYLYKDVEYLGLLTEDKQRVLNFTEVFYHLTGDHSIYDLRSLFDTYELANNITAYKERIENAYFEIEYHDLKDITLTAPMPSRNDILCLGKNYAAHAKELGGTIFEDDKLPKHPIYFTKRASSVQRPGGEIYYDPNFTTQLDYEVELGVVIGKEGRDIAKEDVEDHIFGYTIINDISARDVQHQHVQWFRGKSYETYCPMGPYVVHKSEIEFPPKLAIECRVNGEVRQQDTTDHMIFDIATVVSELSKTFELKRGDVISTGTPAGVGMGFQPPKFLKPGDVIECEIEKLGILRNTVVERP